MILINGPQHEKTCLGGSDHVTQTNLLSYRDYELECWNVVCTLCKFINYTFLRGNNKGADQSVPMLKQVCAFVVRMQRSQIFSGLCPNQSLNDYENNQAGVIILNNGIW